MGLSKNNCACGRNLVYEKCCGLIHQDLKMALTAEDLMRSRFTAFTKGNGLYLNKSHHSLTRLSKKETQDIENWAKSVSWIQLEIVTKTNGLQSESIGTVEFNAFFIEDGKMELIHENSFFEKESGIWMYKNAF